MSTYYSVGRGERGQVPNRGTEPTGTDFYEASQMGIAPSGDIVAVAVEVFQAGYLKPERQTRAQVPSAIVEVYQA